MSDLIVIIGPPASGKAAIGTALAELAGYRLFHNHMTAEPAAALFGWGTAAYGAASEEIRLALLSRALSQPGMPTIIFTFVWAFNLAEDNRFMAQLVQLFESAGRKVLFVELLASVQARVAREGTPLRLSLKPAKHDVVAARALHAEIDGRHRMNSDAHFPYPEDHLIIDTEQQSPAESARLVARRFGLVLPGLPSPRERGHRPMKPWRKLDSKVVLQDRWMSLKAERCELPNGMVLDPYYVIEERDWVHVFAQDDAGQVLTVRQYRYAAQTFCVELPGGVIDDGESPLVAARRELAEETGYAAAAWVQLPSVFANPARQTNRVHLFVARQLQRVGPQQLDESEDITCAFHAPDEIVQMIAGGEYSQALHVCSFYLALGALSSGLQTTSG